MDLDSLLNDAAPPLAPRTPGLTAALDELVLLSEEATGRRRRSLRVVIAGTLAGLGVIGVGGVAAAQGALPSWLPWTSSEGSSCGIAVSAELRRDGKGQLLTTTTPAEQKDALAAARTYLASLDLSSIDRREAADRWFDYLDKVSADHPSRAELEERFQGERLEVHSLLQEVDRDLGLYMTRHGYEPDSVMTTIASRCE